MNLFLYIITYYKIFNLIYLCCMTTIIYNTPNTYNYSLGNADRK